MEPSPEKQFALPPLDIGSIARAIISKTELGQVQAQLLFLEGQYVFIYQEQEKTHCKFLSPTALAQAFAHTDIDSGWLNSHTVRWGHGLSGEWVVQYYPPQQYQIQIHNEKWQIPLPAFVFAGYQTRYWIWASKTKQFDPDAPLYAAPLPNVYGDGAICFGELHPPNCCESQIRRTWELFWQSNFSNHLIQGKSKRYPQDVLKQLMQVTNKRNYPIKDLVLINNSLSEILSAITR
ncbi:hypothetical protein IQ264_01375 [Phormidium sp. LEGE 05292]|uniref:hypothetical protein n=1 Tax=[Phormidium] sp. LEGE 05292 TaxID=767427 RepID=UPI00187FEC5C|nr:hypothetical protein [Phormidium sp. LEGE 05292]MBE9224124.1 hypothetical protein [Phormidium sp. LEGE 05292]